MGHGTEHHREQNPGTGYYKGHDPGTEHGKGCCNGSDHLKVPSPVSAHFKEHSPDPEQCKKHGQENDKKEMGGNDLVAENLTVITGTVLALHSTIDLLVQKTTSMAYHIVAMEEILTEIIAENGLSLAPINARIRARIAIGTDNEGDSNRAIDAAASIASILPHY